MTETIPSWVSSAETAISRACDVAGTREQTEKLHDLQESLNRLLEELPKLVEAAAVGHTTWWHGLTARPELWSDLRSLHETTGSLDSRTIRRFERDATDFLRDARERLRDGWAEHVREVAGETVEFASAVQVLSDTNPGLRNLTDQLNSVLRRLAAASKTLPGERDVQALHDATALFRQIERQLPPRVRDFVIAASGHGGASLEQLDEVREWLADQDLLGSVRVKFGTDKGRMP